MHAWAIQKKFPVYSHILTGAERCGKCGKIVGSGALVDKNMTTGKIVKCPKCKRYP